MRLDIAFRKSPVCFHGFNLHVSTSPRLYVFDEISSLRWQTAHVVVHSRGKLLYQGSGNVVFGINVAEMLEVCEIKAMQRNELCDCSAHNKCGIASGLIRQPGGSVARRSHLISGTMHIVNQGILSEWESK